MIHLDLLCLICKKIEKNRKLLSIINILFRFFWKIKWKN